MDKGGISLLFFVVIVKEIQVKVFFFYSPFSLYILHVIHLPASRNLITLPGIKNATIPKTTPLPFLILMSDSLSHKELQNCLQALATWALTIPFYMHTQTHQPGSWALVQSPQKIPGSFELVGMPQVSREKAN